MFPTRPKLKIRQAECYTKHNRISVNVCIDEYSNRDSARSRCVADLKEFYVEFQLGRFGGEEVYLYI